MNLLRTQWGLSVLQATLDRRDEVRRCMDAIEATAAREHRLLTTDEMDVLDSLQGELRELNARLEQLGARGRV